MQKMENYPMPVLERIQQEISALPLDDQIKLSKWFSLMDGKIWVESKGNGSTFFFECKLESPTDDGCQSGVSCQDTCCI